MLNPLVLYGKTIIKYFHTNKVDPAPCKDMQTSPHPPQKWSSLYKRRALCWNVRKIISSHINIISRFWAIGVQKIQKNAQKIEYSAKVAKFAGKIRIDLTMILYINRCLWCLSQKIEDAQYSDMSWMHCKGKMQNRSYLKN